MDLIAKNKFGGSWRKKFPFLKLTRSNFLTVFKNRSNQKLLYFDGFAGSGDIEVDSSEEAETRH